MAHRSVQVLLFGALLLVFCNIASVYAENDDSEGEVTVETVEDRDYYRSPTVNPAKVHLAEHFDDEAAFARRWVRSEAKKQGVDETIAKYDGKWTLSQPTRKILKNDLGLVLTTEAKHAAIAARLDRPFEFKDKPLVVQYEVTMQEGQNCGGAYLKLLSSSQQLRQFHDQTPYTIMFGPDKCGNDNKLHFIFRHQNPRNGSFEEKHSKKPTQRLEDIYKDKEPHLYTLVVRPDNSYSVLVDQREALSGSLLEDMTPPVNPPEEVDDPADVKPADWDEREKIVDPSASKPEDWDEEAPAQVVDPNAVKPDGWLDDEPEMVSDPEAKRPADWDDDMDGEWEAPLVDNPACAAAPGCGLWRAPVIPNPSYKGIWRAPLIPNPNYKGKWTPRRVPNPDYFRDDHPFRMTPIHAVGFELWSMSPMLLFDNLLITDDVDVAAEWARQSFALKRAKLAKDSQTLWGRLLRAVDYRPGYWALYAAYCFLPVALYAGYLIKRSRETEDSVVERASRFAGENPWVYALLIVVCFVLVGFVAFLCVSGNNKSDDGDAKKTDAVLEDDPHQEEDEQEDASQEDASQEDASQEGTPQHDASPGRASKADLEGPEPGTAEKCHVKPTVAPVIKQKAQASEFERNLRKKMLEVAQPPAEARKANEELQKAKDTPLVEPEGGAGDGQRKRKPRKE